MGLKRIFDARSVAVIGASRDETKRGYQAVKILLDEKYEGAIYPVNPKEDRLFGLTCYENIAKIPFRVDLALITTPARTVPAILEECGACGVRGAVVIAGGFAEIGGEGRSRQEDMIAAARKNGIRVVGPNTSGLISVHSNMNLAGLPNVPKGDIALLTQSGNMALHLVTEASLKSQKGFSYYVGVGNEADIKFHEYLEFFTEDLKTKAIVLYVEGLSAGREFLEQAYKTTLVKPVVLLKSGHSATGRKSAGSHTGALAGISEVSRTAFRRAGIVTIEKSDELFPAAEALSTLPPIRNNKIAILADGGGHATIAADVLDEYGVEVPELCEETQAKLKEILSPNATIVNPIDVAGSTDAAPGIFADCAKILVEDENIGGVILCGLFGGYGIRFSSKLRFMEEDAAHRMGKLVAKTNKPIVLHSLYKFAKPHSLDLMRYYGIPVHDSVDIACKCISVLSEYGQYLSTAQHGKNFAFEWGSKAVPKGKAIIEKALASGSKALLEHQAKRLLALHGAPVPKGERLVKTADAAVKAAEDLGGPVVLKIASVDILHKSEAGGVKLDLEGAAQVKDAFEEIIEGARSYNASADIAGCLISPMAERGMELIIGMKIDDQFGPVVMFGIGGILVEVLKDVVFRVLPIGRSLARGMLEEIKAASLLEGYRGKPPVDKEAIVDLLVTVSDLVESYPEIAEMDLNPVIVRSDGISIVDARIILK